MSEFEKIAERIIATEGVMFALAVAAGKYGDLWKARELLKQAIVKALADVARAGAPDINESIVTPEMRRRGSSVLTELQDAGCYQGYVLEKVYLAMRVLEPAGFQIKETKSSDAAGKGR